MDKAIAFVRALGPGRIAAMVGVAVLMLGFFAFIMIRANEPHYATLYSDLTFEDSSAIVKQLDSSATPYKLKADGAVIQVPQEQIIKLRMKLAETGVPRGGSVGYEIFDKSSTLGSTSFVQNINHIRALEGELARSIRTIDRVQSARVHLVIPEKQLFAREKQETRASIVLKLRGSLDGGQIKAIQQLVASAVNGLKPGNVAIVDERGKLLASAQGESGLEAGTYLEERRMVLERRLREDVESIVANIVGNGRTRVQVSADFEMNRITQTQDTFDPETRVVRSAQSRGESSKTAAQGGDNSGEVSASKELPNASSKSDSSGSAAARDETSKNEETINYEISRITKTEVSEPGRLKRLSVAVLVDGIYTVGADNKATYAPRSKEELDQIAALVRSAVGYSQDRGDKIEVVNLKFADAPMALEAAGAPKGMFDFTFTKDDIMAGIEIFVMFIISMSMILFIARPMMKRAMDSVVDTTANVARAAGFNPNFGSGSGTAATENGAPVFRDENGAVMNAPPGTVIKTVGENGEVKYVPANSTIKAEPQVVTETNSTLAAIELAQISGQMQAVSLQKVGELVEGNPEEAVIIIRQWMSEDDKAAAA